MSDRGRPWRLALALCGFVVAADQGTKALVEANLVPHEDLHLLLGIDLTNVHNTGVAFGLAGGGGDGLIVVTAASLALICVLFARDPGRPGMWIAVGLLTGGALGNLADRARASAVTDFLDPPFWPAFNLADIVIVVGVALLALSYLTGQQRPPTEGGRSVERAGGAR